LLSPAIWKIERSVTSVAVLLSKTVSSIDHGSVSAKSVERFVEMTELVANEKSISLIFPGPLS
jgi:hypothetical protein